MQKIEKKFLELLNHRLKIYVSAQIVMYYRPLYFQYLTSPKSWAVRAMRPAALAFPCRCEVTLSQQLMTYIIPPHLYLISRRCVCLVGQQDLHHPSVTPPSGHMKGSRSILKKHEEGTLGQGTG
jgi:hypothetical protein